MKFISIHPPLAGRDYYGDRVVPFDYEFQSTRPLRGGTVSVTAYYIERGFQSTRPLRGGTVWDHWKEFMGEFQSTRPLRGGTAKVHKNRLQTFAFITIFALSGQCGSCFLGPHWLLSGHDRLYSRCEPMGKQMIASPSHG